MAETTAPSSNLGQAVQALRDFTQGTSDGTWRVRPLDQGEQATVFVAESRNQDQSQTRDPVVIKLYRLASPTQGEFVCRQFDSMSRAHAALSGRTFDGWRISTPIPLHVCRSPLALVMTMVPGTKVSRYLRPGGDLAHDLAAMVPPAIIAAMSEYWRAGQSHGDFNFDNILLEPTTRQISFVDFDMPPLIPCGDGAARWHPASYDLGYMLYDVAMQVKSDSIGPVARDRRLTLAERVLCVFLESETGHENRLHLIDEIQAIARFHLETIDVSLSPRGLWRRALRWLAARRIDATLGRLRARCVPATCAPLADQLARRQ
ncbi:hypothetical protein J6500_08960 [Bradyrhizobium sp. WSM 1704]|uniref:aminoglycoside phosphotransferase family protein n=1 Tax=Bradyrhizobium semiaridum TaxID=2821404 RepID=UPI001CE255C8|nr:aminoglycoside phosphotransferase family protein [Bradyrhizobium semiaridum]MCA6122026.1 hypothetical protein [Bradyrhizobium semiaridum]